MQQTGFTTNVIVGAAMALAFTVPAEALNNRSFVATTGSDANACTPTAACRSFAAALAVTSPGGEIVVVTSGGYGPATINQPVLITAIGIDASITATPGNPGLTINTTGNVTLTGLRLHGEGTASNGIVVSAVGFLRLYDVQVENFAADGIQFGVGGNLALYDSKITDCQIGLAVTNPSAKAYVHNSAFDNNSIAGAQVTGGGMMTIADSSAHYNNIAFYAEGGTMKLIGDRAVFNQVGIAASGTTDPQGAGQLYFADCLLSDNATSYSVASGGTMAGSSPGTTLLTPGQTPSGTLSTAITLL